MKKKAYITPSTLLLVLPSELMVIGGSNGEKSVSFQKNDDDTAPIDDSDPNASRRRSIWDDEE